MKKLIVLLLFSGLFFVGCKQSGDYEAEKESAVMNSDDESIEEFEGHGFNPKNEELQQNKNAPGSIDSHFVTDFELAETRYLEYKVTLVYDSKNVLISRKALLGLVKKYGFLKSSSTSVYDNTPYFNTEVYVKSDDLIKALQEFYLLGKLKTENLEVIDHTPDLIKNTIDKDRAVKRIERRLKYTGKVSTQSDNFTSIEASLESSENSLDAAAFQKWMLEDRVKWAMVNIKIEGPIEKKEIAVPDYKQAFIMLVEFLLGLGYVMILLIPLWLVIIIIIIKKKWFKKTFLSKVKKKN